MRTATDKTLIRIIILDDHELIRAGIRAQLKSNPKISIVGEGSAGEHLERLVNKHRPDVVVLDIEMPQIEGENTRENVKLFRAASEIKRIQKLYADTRILIVSQYLDKAIVETIMDSGANGYLLKEDALTSKLGEAIGAVHQGGVYVSSAVLRLVTHGVESRKRAEVLTDRHKDILREIIRFPGASLADQADHLGISISTLRNHQREMRGRLGVCNKTELALKGVEMGFGDFGYRNKSSR